MQTTQHRVEDVDIEKMIDFASSYFFTKMELKPKNLLSFYQFDNHKWNQHFRHQKEQQQQVFLSFINHIEQTNKESKSQLNSTKIIGSSLPTKNINETVENKQIIDDSKRSSDNIISKSKKSAKSMSRSPEDISRQQSQKSKSIGNEQQSGISDEQSDPSVSKKSENLSTHIKEPESNKKSFQKKPNENKAQLDLNLKGISYKKASDQSQQQQSEQQEQSEINLSQFGSYTDSQGQVRKFHKLQSIQEESSRLSTIRSVKKHNHKEQSNIKRQIFRQSNKKLNKKPNIKSKKSTTQGIKTILQLERIQLSIRQLQQKFQTLINYELEFPKHTQKFIEIKPANQAPRLKLGPVIDLSDNFS